LWGYKLHFKDSDNCSLIPKDKNKGRPISIPQKVGPFGLSAEIVIKMLFDAGIVEESLYTALLETVKAKQKATQEFQSKNLL